MIAWYIEGSDKSILVDTGGGDPSEASPRWLPYPRKSEQTIENSLRKFGLSPSGIDIVLTTRLHWDHTRGNSLFDSRKIIVQEEELRYARLPEANWLIDLRRELATSQWARGQYIDGVEGSNALRSYYSALNQLAEKEAPLPIQYAQQLLYPGFRTYLL